MKVLVGTENISIDKWRELLEKSPYASPFQTPEFYTFFKRTPSTDAEVLAISESNSLTALVVVSIQKEPWLKSYFSRRAIVYGGPLFAKDASSQVVCALMDGMKRLVEEKAIYLEIRNYFDYSKYNELIVQRSYQFQPWLNFQLKTDDMETLMSNMSSSRVRQIKKAKKNGAEWRIASNEEEVKEFYRILYLLYKNKIKKPLFNLTFFLDFFRLNLGKYLLVYHNDTIIGGIMCPVFKGKSIYEYYVCGLDQEYKSQYPSIMATWAAIEYAHKNSLGVFDFMGAGAPDEDYGVREFKARFGGELVEHGRYIKVMNPILYYVGKMGMYVLSKIKK